MGSVSITVIIPCLNEEKTIAKVVQDFHTALPEAELIVFDNGSTDQTARVASEAGATVLVEKRRGKGFVVQAMFQRVDTDIYVMVDGDDTYPVEKVRSLIEPVLKGDADMVIGSRIAEGKSEFRRINWLGNIFFQNIINAIFGTHLTDILSGYRCMNRKLIKSLPLFVKGFEIEAEITIKSLERGFRLAEVPVSLRSRMEGSYSKIRIWGDGLRILGTIFSLFRDYKPLTFFGSLGLTIVMLGLIPAAKLVLTPAQEWLTAQIPNVLISFSLILIGMLFIAVGLVLHTVNRRFQEMEHFMRLMEK
jgi:glycosyltransferase involved in cell wall biosynthesis